jgi:hypothetical protein
MSGLDVVVATDVAVNADMYSERQRMHAVVLFFELESKSFFFNWSRRVLGRLGVNLYTFTHARRLRPTAAPP